MRSCSRVESGRTPRRSELIAATHTLDEIRRYLDADSVSYLSLDGLTGSVSGGATKYCTSCYTGVYPVAFPRNESAYLQLALKLNPDGNPQAAPTPVPEQDGLAAGAATALARASR